jgi:ABC-type branched-subunit amino acid transport system permease subunit
MLLTAAPEVLRFTAEFRLILYGGIIVLVVLWRPNGLLPRRAIGAPIMQTPIGSRHE